MNTELASACRCFGVYDEDNIIAFMGVLHQPHGGNPRIKRVSRLVVLPDYQGIGIGYRFLKIIAEVYHKQGFDFTIVTSAKNLVMRLHKSEHWKMYRLGVTQPSTDKSAIDYKRKSQRNMCKTAGFKYIG